MADREPECYDEGCDVSAAPLADGATTNCSRCGSVFEAVRPNGTDRLQWVDADVAWQLRGPRPTDRKLVKHEPTEVDPVEAGGMRTRIELMPVEVGKMTPLMLDLGHEMAIVIQPKPDQAEDELALNIVVGGALSPEVVAWMLGMASEAIVNGIRRQKLETP